MGAVVVDASKTTVLGEITPDLEGTNLGARFSSGFLVNDNVGTVLQTGSFASDVHASEEPLRVRVPHGKWVIFVDDGTLEEYAGCPTCSGPGSAAPSARESR